MSDMFILLLAAAILIVVVFSMVAAMAIGERNHQLVAQEEGWDPDPADFTDIDFTDDSDDLSLIPERTPEESEVVVEELMEALASGPGEPILLVDPMEVVPSLPFHPPVEPEPEPEPEAEKFATGGIIDPAQVAIIGQPGHIETVIPLESQAEIVTQVQQATASQPATEWKRWNKP